MPRYKLSTDAERHRSKVDQSTTDPDGCWLWTGGIQRDGYGTFSSGSRAQGTFKMGRAHMFALEAALGRTLLPGMQALHTCDVRSCVRNDPPGFYELNGVLRPCHGHLWEGTTQDNTADRHAKGRSASGERNAGYAHPELLPRGETQWLAKLTEDQVREIRRRSAEGAGRTELAAEFGVARTNILKIVQRVTWKHVA